MNSFGYMEKMEGNTTEESEDEEDIEHVYLEEELHNMLIINGGSDSNSVSKKLVKTLGLTTKPHP